MKKPFGRKQTGTLPTRRQQPYIPPFYNAKVTTFALSLGFKYTAELHASSNFTAQIFSFKLFKKLLGGKFHCSAL